MKKPFSLMCVIGLVIFGWIIGIQNKPIVPLPTMSINAAQIPLDLKLGQVRTIRDTVYVKGDTVRIPEQVVVTKTKKVLVPYKVSEPQCFVIPGSLLTIQADRTPTGAEESESLLDSVPARNVTGQTE